ncbi:AsnC family transcriptional regulator [Hydrogenophaga crassostreae]|uniref:AsnC family transcriptional regulator n=1 Tax=Hydrogenophaga crassostreae TaxID=1763535 RepID=A0A162VNH3_9BURK|nr:Lrp/AsnC family transcriptional regulator [Hydrogenophaga crassostreae]AOW11496.1 AsnC family transcriptional regulator [Hydrogenophaga crassostreae]OAD39336.1 AsnC family transcriptional regulator [Hydrogenophaga crassostreae]
MDTQLDLLDRKILAIVQKDSQMNAELIAERVGLSTSAVQRRLRRLRQDKVITAEVAVVNNEAVGRPMTFLAGLEIRENYESLPHLRRWAEQHPEVQQIYYVTGNVDLIMIITAENMKEYDAITERLMGDNPQILRITTNVVIDAIKVGLFVPVE